MRCRNSSARLRWKRISKRGSVERLGQPVDGALRAGIRQNVRDAAAHGEVLLGIEQRVHQLAHRPMRVHAAETRAPIRRPHSTPAAGWRGAPARDRRADPGASAARHPAGDAGPQVGEPREHGVLRPASHRRRRSRFRRGYARLPRSRRLGSAARGVQQRGQRGGVLDVGFVAARPRGSAVRASSTREYAASMRLVIQIADGARAADGHAAGSERPPAAVPSSRSSCSTPAPSASPMRSQPRR